MLLIFTYTVVPKLQGNWYVELLPKGESFNELIKIFNEVHGEKRYCFLLATITLFSHFSSISLPHMQHLLHLLE